MLVFKKKMSIVHKKCPALHGIEFVQGNEIDTINWSSNQIVVLEFWATWCPACLDAIKQLDILHQKYEDQQVAVIGITNETDIEHIKEFAKQNSIFYRIAIDSEEMARNTFLGSSGTYDIPHVVLVDDQGIIRFSGHPTEYGLETQIQKCIQELGQRSRGLKNTVTKTREELNHMSTEELRRLLCDQRISFASNADKDELVNCFLASAA